MMNRADTAKRDAVRLWVVVGSVANALPDSSNQLHFGQRRIHHLAAEHRSQKLHHFFQITDEPRCAFGIGSLRIERRP